MDANVEKQVYSGKPTVHMLIASVHRPASIVVHLKE